jgi:hypothetical protein
MSVDRVHGSGGPRPGGGSRIHGGPWAAAAERLAGAQARGRSGEWKLAGGGGKGEGASEVSTVGEGGWCGAGGRPATVDRNGGGFFSWTRSLEPKGTMRNVAEVCGEGGGAVRCLL